MVSTGPRLVAAGFDVRVPDMSTRRPKPSLRVFADTSSSTAVGASQLADVRWSAVFDDVELTAADIARLAREARPLIHSAAGGSPSTRPTSTRRPLRSPSVSPRPSCRAPTCSASLSASRDRRSPVASRWKAAGGPPICWPPPPTCPAPPSVRRRASSANSAATRPRRWPGSASSTRPASAAASLSTWASARRPPCSPISSPRPVGATAVRPAAVRRPARRW